MPHAVRPARLTAAGVAVITLAAITASAPADAVYLKDGYTLHGRVRREATVMLDPLTGTPLQVFKGSNFFVMDDRVRLVVFNHRNVESADPNVNIRSDFIELTLPLPGNRPSRLPSSAWLEKATTFDEHWQRTVRLRNDLGKSDIKQRLTDLTPYAARVESNTVEWNVCYLTTELGVDEVKKLLATHPDLKEDNGPDVDKRLKRFRFLLQAGWLLAAGEELDRAAADLPKDNKEIRDRLDRARSALKQSQVRELWEEVQTAHRAGRYQFVRGILDRLPVNELDSRVASEAATLKAKYDGWDRQAKDLDRLLNVVNGEVVGPPRPFVLDTESAIRADAGPDTLDRLEPFLTIAGQYEQERKAGKPTTYKPADVFALAVTGWVMGKESAEPKAAAAERYWAGREFALTYLRTHDTAGRKKLLDEYQRQYPLTIDEVTQLISLLPPPEPAAPGPATAQGVADRQTQVPWSLNKSIPYVLKLPPEYRPSRTYPVLIVLRGAGERPADALTRWAAEAARNGYILAAPEWGLTGGGYTYSAEEHAAVTELIKDLRRRYAVDSDRVFLAGHGDGGTMAYDVALSHPDLFAGVVPINALPRGNSVGWYWRNAQYLPFYVVCGELAGKTASVNRYPFENWMSRGYPSLMVVYKGRPTDYFLAEQPFIFDWMNRKKRAAGFPELGRNPNAGPASEEFQTMRPTDNHFYWASVEQINPKYVNHEFGMRPGSPAALQALVRDNNHVFVNTRGIKTLRLWFGRIWDAQSGWRPMVDFSKPVRLTVNGRVWGGRDRPITPSLETMLEDLYQRGDRQRMFLAYVDVTGLQ